MTATASQGTIQQTLERLKAARPQNLPLASLQTDEALQPREAHLVPFRDQARTERRSEEHIGTMRLALEAAQSIELEPLLAADVGGALFVVDGHHRLEAYRRAQRETVPIRVHPMDRQRAVLVSKLVNCGERALAMHPEQCRDAAWQYLAAVTRRGALKLPPGDSCRTLAGRFGIGKDTVSNMLRKLPEVNPKNYAGALDPGTGWPRWRTVREGPAGWKQDLEEMDVEQVTQHRAEMMAKRIGALMDSDTPEVFRRALLLLKIEAQLEAANPDTLSFDVETAEAVDF